MNSIQATTRFASVLLLACSLGLGACASSTQMTPAQNAPFSEGEVDATYKSNGNGSVTVRVKHLGSASKLKSEATTYVVWLIPEGTGTAQNAGALIVDRDMEGTLDFQTSFKSFKLMVTPEASADVTSMTGPSVLSADVVAD